MPWSTRQLAELTGVTLRSIRHWHDVGLLPEPERLSNGYKQYTVNHLVLALRIARLTNLGFGLERVSEMIEDEDESDASLRALRDELDSRILSLTRIRSSITELIQRGVPPDISPEAFTALEAIGVEPGSRNIAILIARLLPPTDLPSFSTMMRNPPEGFSLINSELLNLTEEASEKDIEALANKSAIIIRKFLDENKDSIPRVGSNFEDQVDANAVIELMSEHLNSAQLRALALTMKKVS